MRHEYFIPDESTMENLGKAVAGICSGGEWIYLEGELGTGKTTFARGFLQAFGKIEKVKSPTYTLIEPYLFNGLEILHIDLYRLSDIEELELIGFRDIFDHQKILLIEWASRVKEWLPKPDIEIFLEFDGQGRRAIIQGKGVKAFNFD